MTTAVEAVPANVESQQSLEVTSTIVPAPPPEVAPTSSTASTAPVLQATPAVTGAWMPRRQRLDASAWSVLGVAPLYPQPQAPVASATSRPAVDPPSEASRPPSMTAVVDTHAAAEPSTRAPMPIGSAVPAAAEVHAPKPLASEPPVKPVFADVAAPLKLPSCITQQPIPAAHAAAAPPAPPSATVALATAPKTAGPALSPLLPMLLLAATALAAVATVGAVFIVSRSRTSESSARRSLNIASRITISFGSVAVVILGACWYGASAASSLAAQITFCVLAAAAGTLCIVGGVWLSRSILDPLAKSVTFMRSLSSGNLMVAPLNSTARHEIGDLARCADKLAAAMRDVISEVSISSSEVAAAAHELATGAQGMAVAAGQLSSQCTVAGGDASATGRLATSGGRAVQQATEEIARLDTFVRERTDEVSELAERNKQIARIVSLIDDISDRTHLVALNASIEASKAGPEARAFSVLAEEVRRLAERSLKAVEEATATVRAVQDDTRSAAEKMSFAALQIKQGADMADRASHDLAEIIRTSGGVATSIQSLTSAAEEAGAGAAQSASAAAQLCSRADDLKAMVARFRLDTSAFMRRTPAAVVAAPASVESPAKAA